MGGGRLLFLFYPSVGISFMWNLICTVFETVAILWQKEWFWVIFVHLHPIGRQISSPRPNLIIYYFFRNHQNSLQSFLMVNEYYHFECWQQNITYHFLLIYFHGGIITYTVTFYKMINLRTKLNFIISLLFFCGQACLSYINV